MQLEKSGFNEQSRDVQLAGICPVTDPEGPWQCSRKPIKEPWRGLGHISTIVLPERAFRPALGYTQPFIQWV